MVLLLKVMHYLEKHFFVQRQQIDLLLNKTIYFYTIYQSADKMMWMAAWQQSYIFQL